mgnify:CR=1 FL=1
MVIEHFLNIQDVDSDGMYVISSLAIVFRKAIGNVLDGYWPYLERGLEKVVLL